MPRDLHHTEPRLGQEHPLAKLPNKPRGNAGFTPYAAEQKPEPSPNTALPPLPSKGKSPALQRPKASLWLRMLRIGFGISLAASIMVGAFGYLWLSELGVFDINESTLDTIVKARPSDNSLVYDRDGNKIGEYFSTYHVFVPFEKLPKHLVDAIVAIEDRNFWHHKGFDPKGMGRALWARLRGHTQVQGASTLTQQVVRQFLLTRERSLARKVQEIAIAIHLEQRLSKEKLLEIYANRMFLGNGSYGVGAAAYRYFGKSLAELEPHESALIAGLFQSPSRFNPTRYPKRAKKRQTQVIRAMYASGSLSLQGAKELLKEPLHYGTYRPINAAVAPYFIDYVREQAGKLLDGKLTSVAGQGLRIYTTLDSKLQKFAEQAVGEQGKALDDAQKRTQQVKEPDGSLRSATVEAAILATDPKSGEVLAMVGGRDYEKTKFNRTYQAMRSPGSSFKPVVYSLALATTWKWSDMIFVSPVTIANYRPHTPDDDYLTETTLMRAFYRSMNTPTVELGQKLGLRPIIEHAKLLGIRSPIKEEFGTTLGSSDVTMFDLARVYGTFANSGQRVEPIAIQTIKDRDGNILYQAPKAAERSAQAVSEQNAFLMTQGMKAVLSMGTGYASSKLANRAAGKTGTSNDSTDNWFCGYSPDLVAIVWTGTDEHARMSGDITGGKLSLPIWDKFMTRALEVRPSPALTVPKGVVSATVHPRFGHRSANGIRMYFLEGNEPADEPSALEVLSSQEEGGGYRDVFGH